MVLHRTHVVQDVTTRLILHVLVIPQQHSSLLLTASTYNHICLFTDGLPPSHTQCLLNMEMVQAYTGTGGFTFRLSVSKQTGFEMLFKGIYSMIISHIRKQQVPHVWSWDQECLSSKLSLYSWKKAVMRRITGKVEQKQAVWKEFNVPLQHKYRYIKDKRSAVESYPYPVKEGQQCINLNPGCLFVQQPPKKRKGSRGSFKLSFYCLQQGETTIIQQDKTSFVRFSINNIGVLPVYHIILIANMICDCRFVADTGSPSLFCSSKYSCNAIHFFACWRNRKATGSKSKRTS